MRRLCVVTTSDLIVRFFLTGLLRALAERYELTVVVKTDHLDLLSRHGVPAELTPIDIERGIGPLADLAALGALARLFRRRKFEAVISLAPKAGLLAAIAGKLTGVPFRCHVFQGEVWAMARGAKRALLKALDRLVVRLATHLLVISSSERAVLEREGVLAPGQATLIAKGSLAGVDLRRFRADPAWRREVRAALDIPESARVVLFLGRLTRDKGVVDLAGAFRNVAASRPDTFLVYTGPDEQDLQPDILRAAGDLGARLRFAPLTDHPERHIAAADLLALPSYREGFGNVLIEAAAAGVPALASRIYGIEDALRDGETGLMHPAGDVASIAAGMARLLDDADLRSRLGRQARERAAQDFSSDQVIAFWLGFLERNLASR